MNRVRVWDLPLRLFHWLLVAMFALAWWSAGHPRYLDLHLLAGYTTAALLLFRLIWGFVGSYFARFRNFAYGPNAVVGYLRDLFTSRAAHTIGHNPAGSWAIFSMLLLLLAITVSGLVVLGGEEGLGPLSSSISLATGIAWHEPHEVLAWAMVGLVAIHLVGVVVESRLHRENLVAAMLSGYKQAKQKLPHSANYRAVAAVMAAIWLVVAGSLAFARLSADAKHPYQPFTTAPLVDNELWRSECGSCHQAYHPQLLPARSWLRLFDQQNDHFGEALELDEATLNKLLEFHMQNAADHPVMEAAWYVTHSLSENEAPLRITETPYWRKTHADIPDAMWRDPRVNGRGNCAACHSDAEQNTFTDAAMRLPPPNPKGERR